MVYLSPVQVDSDGVKAMIRGL